MNSSDSPAADGPGRFLFDRMPVSLWEEDLSDVKARIEELRRQGVVDFGDFFRSHPDTAAETVRRARVVDVNQATLELFGAVDKADLLENLDKVLGPGSSPLYRLTPNLLCLALNEDRCSGEFPAQTLQGKPLHLAFTWNVAAGGTATYARVFYALFDITRRKQAEEERARLAEDLRQAQKLEAIAVLAGAGSHTTSTTSSRPSAAARTSWTRAFPRVRTRPTRSTTSARRPNARRS